MALPSTLDKDDPAGSDAASSIDNVIRALKLWIQDVFGLADDVAIAAALGSITSAGLQYWTFQDTAGNPGATGRLQRNAAALMFHDGTSAQTVAMLASTQTLTNKTLTSPTLGGTITGAASSVYVPAAVAGTPVAHGLYRDNVCKAWAAINYTAGTPALQESYNVSGIVDDGVGVVTVQWDRDFGAGTYAVVAMAGSSTANATLLVHANSARGGASVRLRIVNESGTATDPGYVSVMAFGAQ